MLHVVPPLSVFCITVLARFPDELHHLHARRVQPSPAVLDTLHDNRDPCLWAALAQLVHPLPPHLHDHDLPLSHPDLPLLQRIPDTPDFSLVTLLSLPNCTRLCDDDIAHIRTLRRLLALDLRGCPISSHTLAILARDLAGTNTLGLRLLGLHGCPNVDDDVLPALQKFTLLSAVDLRFTRCTPSAVDAHLAPLGFRPSSNNSLFHPAPLSLALCTLEKIALTSPDPIPLYSCPPESVFRVHIDQLDHHPLQPNKIAPVRGSGASHSAIRTMSSTKDIVVFNPPLRKPTKNVSSLPSKSLALVTLDSIVPTTFPIDEPAHSNFVSNVSSFYAGAPACNKHSRKSIIPLAAQAVQSSQSGKLDPLAIARSPPPWKAVDTHKSHVQSDVSNAAAQDQGASSNNVEDARQRQPIARWTGRTLNNPLKVDRARLHKCGTDAVSEMVHQFATKRLKVESQFALAKARTHVTVRSRNPFVRSVFAESSANADKLQYSVHGPSKEVGPGTQLRVCRSLPSDTVWQQVKDIGGAVKPLKPITTFKPPILPKELLPSVPRQVSKPKVDLKQTRLAFRREGVDG